MIHSIPVGFSIDDSRGILDPRGMVGERLGVSVETVRTHLKHIYDKWDVRDRLQAVIAAYDSGLVGAPSLDSAPLIVMDPSSPASEESLDMAVRMMSSFF